MDSHGWIPISTIASFNRVRALTYGYDPVLIREVLQLSALVEVEVEKEKVRLAGGRWRQYVLPDAGESDVLEREMGGGAEAGEGYDGGAAGMYGYQPQGMPPPPPPGQLEGMYAAYPGPPPPHHHHHHPPPPHHHHPHAHQAGFVQQQQLMPYGMVPHAGGPYGGPGYGGMYGGQGQGREGGGYPYLAVQQGEEGEGEGAEREEGEVVVSLEEGER